MSTINATNAIDLLSSMGQLVNFSPHYRVINATIPCYHLSELAVPAGWTAALVAASPWRTEEYCTLSLPSEGESWIFCFWELRTNSSYFRPGVHCKMKGAWITPALLWYSIEDGYIVSSVGATCRLRMRCLYTSAHNYSLIAPWHISIIRNRKTVAMAMVTKYKLYIQCVEMRKSYCQKASPMTLQCQVRIKYLFHVIYNS